MGNCKKCGALIGADFVFCGKCGEPVNRHRNEEILIKAKKLRRLRRFERKLSGSALLNGIFSGVWAVLGVLWSLLFLGGLRDIRIETGGIGTVWNQLILKYDYVREGLSLSYISAEFTQVADYIFLWIFTVFSAIMAISSIVLLAAHLIKAISLKKGVRDNAALSKIRLTVSRICIGFILLFAVLAIITGILKGIV